MTPPSSWHRPREDPQAVPEAPPPALVTSAAPSGPGGRPHRQRSLAWPVGSRFGPGKAGGPFGAMRKLAAGFLLSLLKGERFPPIRLPRPHPAWVLCPPKPSYSFGNVSPGGRVGPEA